MLSRSNLVARTLWTLSEVLNEMAQVLGLLSDVHTPRAATTVLF